MPTTKDVIVRLLRSLGTRKEVEQYLRAYSAVDSQKFAVIQAGGDVLADDLEALATSLSFLNQVGLVPIVIHGAGPRLDAALAEAGIAAEEVDGRRVTTPRVLEVARRVLQRDNLRLVEALEELGTRARPVTAGVFEAALPDDGRLGLEGSVSRVHVDAVASSIRAGHLPVLAALGETPGGQIVTLDPDVATRALALATQPFKIVLLTASGGILDQAGGVLSAINLAEDYVGLAEAPWLDAASRRGLAEIRRLLEGLPHASSVSITSPDHLARELFTHTGSGTLVRRGERVLCHETLATVDRARLRDLLEACFQRRLDDHYFEEKVFHRIYLAESYRATAILTLDAKGAPEAPADRAARGPRVEGAAPPVPYLDKLAVTSEARGAGVGSSLWARMKGENPRLFWRARNGNEINTWYFQQAEGCYRDAQWTVFWYGLTGFDEIRACVAHALALPATLRDHGTAAV